MLKQYPRRNSDLHPALRTIVLNITVLKQNYLKGILVDCELTNAIEYMVRHKVTKIRQVFVKSVKVVSVVVCKQYFLNTFCVSDGRVTEALKKIIEGKTPGYDLRGAKAAISKKYPYKRCDIFKRKCSNPELSDAEKVKMQSYHELHLRKADLARDCMKYDANSAKNDPKTYVYIINQKFLVPGHSYLPNDSDFGCVELTAKGEVIYLSEQLYIILTILTSSSVE
ncbi:hypothetical protein PR048_017223 [Dryococelus australis]|uniref:Uncharacterized protein n=1 Tax=Dryococelus australis TaxID=614101 RepID=A0ABQ9H8Y0_9NEOP|nr:hypothetical protein PR048_017223 [Dryococelus australis]